MALKKGVLYICSVIFLILLSQDCHASILGGEVELGWPKGEYYVHFGSDPVNLKNGNLYYPVTDLFIPSVGFPLTVSRSYNSRSSYSGIFGFGWSSSLDVRAEIYEKTVVIMEEDGFRDTCIFASKEGEIRRFQSASGRTIEVSKSHSIMFDPRTGEKRTFDRDGKILEQTDRYGNKQTFSYNPKGHLTQVQGTAGRLLNIQTDDSGKVVQITDPIEREIRYKYDSRGNLIEVIDKGGHRTGLTYDDLHNLTAIEYPNGGKTLLTYDVTRDLIVEESGPEDRRTRYRYKIQPENLEAWSVEVINALENVTRYDYSKNGSHLIITDALGGKVIKEACIDCGGSLSAYTDARGNTTRYEYTSEKGYQITTITDPLGHKTKRYYDETTGNLLKEIAPNDATTLYSYDKAGNLIESKDALGNSAKYVYDQRGQLAQVTDKRGGITKFRYDRYGNLIAQTDPMGYQTRFEYDLVGRLVKILDPKGGVTEFEFTADDYIASTKDPLRYVVRNEYNEAGLLVKASDSNSVLTKLSYNQAGDLLQAADAMNQINKMDYDSLGRMISLTNTRGFKWRFRYDALGRGVERVDPLKNKEIRTYDSTGNLVRIEEPGGDVTLFEYDALNRLKKITNPLGLITTYFYDEVGNMVQIKDDAGNFSYYVYDLVGRLVLEVDSLGRDRRYAYDTSGNLISAWIPYQTRTEYEYDPNNRLTKATYPGKGELIFKYDAAGNPIESTDPLGRKRRLTFDVRDQLIQDNDYNGQVKGYKRDIKGNIVELSQQDVPMIRLSYDSLDRIVKKEGPGDRIEIYTYDGESNLISSGRRGKTTSFSYDALNRLSAIRYPDETTVSYSYDAAGNMVRWANGHSDVRAEYGPFRTMRSISYMHADVHLSMKYDELGNLSAINLPNSRQIQYEYDSLRQLRQISLTNGPRVKLTRDEHGRVIRRDYSNGFSQLNNYTKHGRTSAIKIGRVPNDYSWERQYQYDKMGNLIAESGGNEHFTYSYEMDRLVGADLGPYGTLKLHYDMSGNLILKERADETEAYKYNSLGQLVHAEREDFLWDDVGNLVERKNGTHHVRYGYNKDSQLKRVSFDSGDPVLYDYDALGTPIYRQYQSTTNYLVQIEGILRLISDEKGRVQEVVVYEDLDRPLFSQKGKKIFFYHQDALENVILLTDADGSVVDQRTYSPFGIILSGNPELDDLTYSAISFDSVTGLYKMGFRHYDAKLSIFLTSDPLENFYSYAYANNNPLKFKDPLGLVAQNRNQECSGQLEQYSRAINSYLSNSLKLEQITREHKIHKETIDNNLSKINAYNALIKRIRNHQWWIQGWKWTAIVTGGSSALMLGYAGIKAAIAAYGSTKVAATGLTAQFAAVNRHFSSGWTWVKLNYPMIRDITGGVFTIASGVTTTAAAIWSTPDIWLRDLKAAKVKLNQAINSLSSLNKKLTMKLNKINPLLNKLKRRNPHLKSQLDINKAAYDKCVEAAECENQRRARQGLSPLPIAGF